MAADPGVHVLGEDVGTLGGVFRVTDGLAAEFGEDRCTDTPLAEAGILGTAVGMAMYGLRPVVEMQFDAFAYPAFEQVVSHVTKMRNRTRGKMPLPLTIRVLRGRHRRRRAPQRLVRGVLHGDSGAPCRHARDGRRRLRAAARVHRLRRPGGLPRTEAAVLVEGLVEPRGAGVR